MPDPHGQDIASSKSLKYLIGKCNDNTYTIKMGKGYYWIEPVDLSLNGEVHNRTGLVSEPIFYVDSGVMVIRTWFIFEVGTIFHVMGHDIPFVVCKRMFGRNWGTAIRPMVDGGWTDDMIDLFKKGSILIRIGFVYDNCNK